MKAAVSFVRATQTALGFSLGLGVSLGLGGLGIALTLAALDSPLDERSRSIDAGLWVTAVAATMLGAAILSLTKRLTVLDVGAGVLAAALFANGVLALTNAGVFDCTIGRPPVASMEMEEIAVPGDLLESAGLAEGDEVLLVIVTRQLKANGEEAFETKSVPATISELPSDDPAGAIIDEVPRGEEDGNLSDVASALARAHRIDAFDREIPVPDMPLACPRTA